MMMMEGGIELQYISRWNIPGELLFLGVGLHMAYHLRNAQAPWNERRYYSAALLIEVSRSIFSSSTNTHEPYAPPRADDNAAGRTLTV